MSTNVYNDSRIISTLSSEFNSSYNDTMVPSNESFGEDITGDILWYFYDKLHSKTNYFLIILYVPVMALAVTANILVIAVVFKYHYMRRYVYIHYSILLLLHPIKYVLIQSFTFLLAPLKNYLLHAVLLNSIYIHNIFKSCTVSNTKHLLESLMIE